jgi:hypothetical protein
MTVLNKYKWLLAIFVISLMVIFSITNYMAFYTITGYWIFIGIELGGITLLIFIFFIIFRLESIIKESGYIHNSELKRMNLKCETMKESLNKALDKNYLSTMPNESPASNRERIKAKKIK